MIQNFQKDIDANQLLTEAKVAGINITSITRDKNNNLIVDTAQDCTTLINNHVKQAKPNPKDEYAALLTDSERINYIATRLNLK